MGLFDHEARQLKFDVLVEVAHRSYSESIDSNIEDDIAYKLIPTPKADFRCCVYKEREILRQRTRLAMGKDPVKTGKKCSKATQVVKVIEAACDGCSIRKIQITDNCRKCMAKSCMKSCRFDAISMGEKRAIINYDKCKECGACVSKCPFHAIVETHRPCVTSCPVDAISMDQYNLAIIDEDKCINCAQCQSSCPFGAIEDASWIVPVIESISRNKSVYAMVAPSIQGQFGSASYGQIKTGLINLGFKDVIEVAAAADIVAWHEKEELKRKVQNNSKLTTSCCPAFVNLAKQHFSDVYDKFVSTLVSPMILMGRLIKETDPNAICVFIGPCVTKKQEAMMDESNSVDYVLTYEEIAAMFVSSGMYLSQGHDQEVADASVFGRYFAFSGGVSKALSQAAKEDDNIQVKAISASGCTECKKQLLLLRHNRFEGDVLEGMGCLGGCFNGPAMIDNSTVIKKRFDQDNEHYKKQSIKQNIAKFNVTDAMLHTHKAQ